LVFGAQAYRYVTLSRTAPADASTLVFRVRDIEEGLGMQ